jgi:putative transposase
VASRLTASEVRWVLLNLAYLTLCRSIQLLVLLARGDAAKDLEILVLGHQLAELRRQTHRRVTGAWTHPHRQTRATAIGPGVVMDLTRPRDRRPPAGGRSYTTRRPPSWPATCFTVDTVGLRRLQVQCFIELGSRRVHLGGVTSHPDGAWVTQQARNLFLATADGGLRLRFVLRDRDARFCRGFDDVFGAEVLVTPVQARTPTPMRSGGSVPSAPSAWTGC